jgi:hypothetical protein
MVNAPPSSFLRVSMDSGVMMPMIFVMASFWATSILHAPFLDDFVDIVPTLLLEREDVDSLVVCISSGSMALED